MSKGYSDLAGAAQADQFVVLPCFSIPSDGAVVDHEVIGRGYGRAMSDPVVGVVNRFSADIRLLTKAEGGRHTPVFDKYRPAVRFPSGTSTGTVGLDPATPMLMPGVEASVSVALLVPMQIGVGEPFELFEGDRLVGVGVVRHLG
jgi:translation elongation factor EF-Tu-like GTPase